MSGSHPRSTSVHIPLARLCPRQQGENDDPLRRRVHSAIPASRLAEGIRPFPSLRRDGQLPAVRIDRSVPEVVKHEPTDTFRRRPPIQCNVVMHSMSHSFDRRGKANSGSTLLEVFDGLFHRFLLMVWPYETLDLLRHVFADVCLPAQFPRLPPKISACLTESRKPIAFCITYRGASASSAGPSSRDNFNPH